MSAAKVDREQLAEQLERLQEQLKALEEWAEAVEDEADDDRIAALRYEVTLDVDRFLAAAAMLVRSIEARKAGRAAELAALQERLGKLNTADDRRVATVERLVAAFLEERGKGTSCRIKGRARLQWSPGTIEVEKTCPIDLLPEEVRKIIPAQVTVDKRAARRMIKDGEELPGISLQRVRSVKWEC